MASSTNPATWTTHAEARASRAGVGLGFVLDGDGLVCLDIDHCIEDGRLVPDVAAMVAELPATYTEISPSGTGLHLWFLGSLPRDGHLVVHGVRVEAYSTGRFITITGKRFGRAPSQLARLPEVTGYGRTRSRP